MSKNVLGALKSQLSQNFTLECIPLFDYGQQLLLWSLLFVRSHVLLVYYDNALGSFSTEIYIYIYIYIYICVHIYIYVYIYREREIYGALPT